MMISLEQQLLTMIETMRCILWQKMREIDVLNLTKEVDRNVVDDTTALQKDMSSKEEAQRAQHKQYQLKPTANRYCSL